MERDTAAREVQKNLRYQRLGSFKLVMGALQAIYLDYRLLYRLLTLLCP
jgi:hypothetical protein